MSRGIFFAGFFAAWIALLLPSPSPAAGDGLEPADSIKTIRLAEPLRIELVVAEPDVVDPVAVAWDEFGRMYVVEMRDYPNGPGEGKPFLSRVKLLQDSDGDGRYESVRVFADELPFANGVLPWRGGVIVTAAPDVWFLKDSDDDGRADVKEKLFTGFKEGNPQLRVNHPTLGMDNWIYVANGLSGGEVSKAGDDSRKIPIPQMDFRFHPDRGEYEATAGNAQFGIAFDDRGNRFMCSNRQHVAQIVLPDRYLKRNPHLRVAKTVIDIPDHGAAARIFPLAATRTTAVEHAGSFTAACGLTIYRGTALPEEYRGNSFVCDPTGYLVHRDVLEPDGPAFVARRAPEEARHEFIASTDEWFRPVNLMNAPDGSLYLADMYRETIEHPQYMPKGLAETLELRKGDDRGRIYRIASGEARRPIAAWPGTMSASELVAALRHPDAWWRETAQRLLVERRDSASVEPLRRLLVDAEPVAKLHALWTLEGIGQLDDADLVRAMRDPASSVREHAARLAEPRVKESGRLADALLPLSRDPDRRVRWQTALAIGYRVAGDASAAGGDDAAVAELAAIAARDVADPWVQIAVLSSSAGAGARLWSKLDDAFSSRPAADKAEFVYKLASAIGAAGDRGQIEAFLSDRRWREPRPHDAWWQLGAIDGLADGLRPGGKRLQNVVAELGETVRPAADRIEQLMRDAALIAREKSRSVPERVAAIRPLGHSPFADVEPVFRELLQVSEAQEVQVAAVQAVAGIQDAGVVPLLLEGWAGHSPIVRRHIIDAAFSRRERIVQLLDAIESGTVRGADLDLQRHQQLLNHGVKEIKDRAVKLFESEGTPNRKAVIESYRTILTRTGNVEAGRAVFQKNCANCHRVHGDGHRVGPELTGLRTRNKEALLMDILDPNRALEPNYANYLVATRDGRVLSGIIASESATSITLRRAEGVEETLLREEIEQLRASGQSLMPEGLERTVSESEMVDLIEFLKSVP